MLASIHVRALPRGHARPMASGQGWVRRARERIGVRIPQCIAHALLAMLPLTAAAQPSLDTDALERFFKTLETNHRFMGTVFLMRGDEPAFSGAYGFRDSGRAPASLETVYRVGSISKTFAAAIIMQLVEQGELALDDDVATFFPELPNAEHITIRQLLHHRSGLANITDLPDYDEYYTRPQTRSAMLERITTAGSRSAPDENQAYNNTGYILLGYIIEDVTGKPYAKVLRERVTIPLALTSTRYGGTIDPAAGDAKPFAWQGGAWHPMPETDMSIPHAAGALVSTAPDVARFYRALHSGALLGSDAWAELQRYDGELGPGLMRLAFHDRVANGHAGGIDGFLAFAGHFAEDDVTFALTANAINYDFDAILTGFLSLVFGVDHVLPDFTMRETQPLSKDQIDAYVGCYTAATLPIELRLFVRDGALMAQATGQPAVPLAARDPLTLVYDRAGIELVFESTTEGRFTTFVLHQAGQSFSFSRADQSGEKSR